MSDNSSAAAAFASVPMGRVKEWRTAYGVALANAFVFLLLATGVFLLKPSSLAAILAAPALFSVGALLSFLLMVRSGGACAAIAWFVLGSGVFFGLGVVVGGIIPNPVSAHSIAESILFRDLIRVNLLNASSVFIVLAVAYPLANIRGFKATNSHTALHEPVAHAMNKIFPFVAAVSAVAVVLKFVLFPIAENLVLRSVSSALYLSIPLCLFLLGMLWRSLGRHLQLIACSVFFLEILNGLINFNKLQIISALLAVVIGAWLSRHTLRFLAMSLGLAAAVFVTINPLVNSGRGHINYHPATNTVVTRIAILGDVVSGISGGISGKSDTASSGPKITSAGETVLLPGLTRLSVPFIQGYLISEYENNRAGKSLEEFWVAVIPRVLWPDKPIITRFGQELYARYYNHPPTSALAPTYSAEAYWNYGLIGVVLVSILLGLEFGWLTHRAQLAMAGKDPAFFLIAAPVATWAMQVEAWVVATYVGGFMQFFIIWLFANIAFRRIRLA